MKTFYLKHNENLVVHMFDMTIVCRGPVYAMFVLWGMDMTNMERFESP